MALKIRKELLPVKVHFFLASGGFAAVALYSATYARQLGFSAVLVGSIFTILPIISTTVKLIMGPLADRFKCHKSMLIFFLVIFLASVSLLNFVTPINKEVKADLICDSNESSVKLCSEGKGDKCIISKIRNEYNDNSTIICKMGCIVDDQFIDLVCETWNSSEYCKILNSKRYKNSGMMQSQTADVNKLNERSLNDSHFIILPTETTASLMSFNAELLPHHVKQDGRCLSFVIGGIKDLSSLLQENLHELTCDTMKEYSCQMICSSPLITDIGTIIDEESAIYHKQFWFFVIIMAFAWAGNGTITIVGETICFGLLSDRPSEFGRQRLWGSLGWGMTGFVAGILVDYVSQDKSQKNYMPIFCASAVLLGMDIINSSCIKDTKRTKSSSIMWDIGKLFTDIRVIIYVIWCTCMGMSTGIIASFLFWHLEDMTDCDDLQNVKTLEGIIVLVQTLCSEMPFFFLSPWLLNKIGHINSMSLTLFTSGLSFLLYSVMDNPIYFLPVSLFGGITFSTMYATMTSYASIISPPGTAATMQGLVGSIYEGLGVSLGSFLAGLLMNNLKSGEVFQLYGIGGILLCVLHVCVQYILQRSQKSLPVTTDIGSGKSVRYTSPENAVRILNENKS